MSLLQESIRHKLQGNERSPADIAGQLQCSELEVIRHLPTEQAYIAQGVQAQYILEQLPRWGTLTTIVIIHGSVFEIKGNFPQGKCGYGFYNLQSGTDSGLQGHLKLDEVQSVALISRPRRGKEARYVGFYTGAGECIWKSYLGRDETGNLMPSQVLLFEQLLHELTTTRG